MQANEQPLAVRIRSVNNQIRRLLEKNAPILEDAELTGVQFAILGFLGEKVGSIDIYQKDIEAEFNIRRSTASGILKLMEKNGYIRRVYDTVDTRLKKITLTEKALELDKAARVNIVDLQARLTRGIDPAEMDRFYRTLEKISINARE